MKTVNRAANRYLALALITMILWMMRVLISDLWPGSFLPFQFLLALGPLLYHYVLKITQPKYLCRWKDLIHLSPLLIEQSILPFKQLSPVLLMLTFVSVIVYLYKSNRLIEDFYIRQPLILTDRSRLEWRWLQRLLAATAILCCMWISYAAADYFIYGNRLDSHLYYPFYIFCAIMTIWTAAAAFLRPQAAVKPQIPASPQPVSAQLREKAIFLRKTMETYRYYEIPELNLTLLAEKVKLHPHELSRVINTVLKKNFNDFINEFRVRDVIIKMGNPAHDNMTLLGIAYETGFNSQTSFNRIFKQLTGKSPLEYKDSLKKEQPTYHLGNRVSFPALISGHQTTAKWHVVKLNRTYMFKNYLRISWRNLTKNKAFSLINIGGLAVGMAVSMLIGLWIWDEMSFDKHHEHYARIAQVLQQKTLNGVVNTDEAVPYPVGPELRRSYGNDFKYVVLTSWTEQHILATDDKKITATGNFMEADGPEMFSLTMAEGSRDVLKGPSSILVSESLARTLFGNTQAIGRLVKLDNNPSFTIAGIYKNLPQNTTMRDVDFIAPWDYYKTSQQWIQKSTDNWGENSFRLFVEIAGNADMEKVSQRIRNIKLDNIPKEDRIYHPAMLLHPMSKWHLYTEFKNGVNTGGAIGYVWMFGIIGLFVLLLACINFMNLSTARSEKRAKEVGIRKAIGGLRSQLTMQFFFEAGLMAAFAFVFSLLLILLAVPSFNQLSGKQIDIPYNNIYFWLAGVAFTLFTGIIAGSYPALYLSSFSPVKVLKGVFKAERFASVPRRILVVVQFSVSVTLIIGTITIFRQVEFAKDRPLGYNRQGLMNVPTVTEDIDKHFDALRHDLIRSGAVREIAQSSSPMTAVHNSKEDIGWKDKDPFATYDFGTIAVSAEYGRTIGWELKQGRDFSGQMLTDSSAIILNEAAVKYIGFKDALGETVSMSGRNYKVIGVVNDLVLQNPYQPARQTIFYLGKGDFDQMVISLKPNISVHDAIAGITGILKNYSPAIPFTFNFVDEEYAKKFGNEELIGRLAGVFAALAIFISCLGLFGMASFVAEQRVKEIGVRKVLGASVFGLWRLLSKDFLMLVFISLIVAMPIAWWMMYNWLQDYTYRTDLSWWIFAAAGFGALLVTMLTVSYQSIKAALANPVKSLRSE